MQLEPHRCPTCEELATGILEKIPVIARIECYDSGSAEYVVRLQHLGWDDQTPDTNIDGTVTLQCAQGHRWRAIMHD